MTDKELQLKKTARRRLVGAVTLVILMLVILPFVLKDRVAELAQNDVKITVINQSQSEPMLQLPDEALAIEPAADADVSSAKTESPTAVADKPLPEVAKPLAEVVAQSADKPSVAAVQSPVTNNPPSKKPEAKVDRVVAVDKAVAASPAAERKPVEKVTVVTEKPAVAATGKFFVQLGVFSDPKNLDSLRARIQLAGFNAVSEPVDAASAHLRLRSAIFHDRDTAQAELKKLQAAGFSGMVTGKP